MADMPRDMVTDGRKLLNIYFFFFLTIMHITRVFCCQYGTLSYDQSQSFHEYEDFYQ